MSDAIFPVLPGLSWGSSKTMLWTGTRGRKSVSGLEARASYQVYPNYRIKLQYEFLRAGAEAELQTLVGFFNSRGGDFDSFLWTDPDDNTVTGDTFGTGDGVATTFRLGRTLGGFWEPVSAINGTPSIYKGGVLQSSGYTLDATAAKVTFSSAPASGVALTWSGSYYWRVRFERGDNEFRQFLEDLWEAKQVNVLTVKTL